MKKTYKINAGFLLLSAAMSLILLMTSCKKATEPAPVITSVINYEASPADSVLSGIVPDGQWVVISGQNLKNALAITFNGVPATFNHALFSQNSVVVQIPSIVFSTIDTNKLNTVEYTTPGGTAIFSFRLTPATPTITAISNVFANPGDSVFIYGANLVLVQSFSYGGTNIPSFKSDYYGTSLGFVMPNPAPSSGNVVITTKSGTVVFKIVATPTITGVSNENAVTDDSVWIYGTYLKSIQTFTFAGASITSFISSADGSVVGFKMPSISTSGPVSITTPFGAATTVYNVKDVNTGNLANFEWGNGWQWWGGSQLYSGDPSSGWPSYNSNFPGNRGHFQILQTGLLSPGEGNNYSSYAVRIANGQWIPTANLNDPITDWALKFEVSVKNPWNGGTFDISPSSTTYIARWEPWQVSATTTAAYKTNGWVTITIPFSMFKAKDATLGVGKGAPIAKLSDLVGTTGKSELIAFITNHGTANTPTGFYGAFDNFRVVKIK